MLWKEYQIYNQFGNIETFMKVSFMTAVNGCKKFQCPECEHQATKKVNLVRHQKSVHLGQQLHCPECDYQATQKSNLATLHKSVHMSQKFQCQECEHKLSVKYGIITHQQ